MPASDRRDGRIGELGGLRVVPVDGRPQRGTQVRRHRRARRDDHVVGARVQQPAARGDPGVEQPGRLECGLQAGPVRLAHPLVEVDRPPQRRAGAAVPHAGRAGVRDRRRIVLAALEALALLD